LFLEMRVTTFEAQTVRPRIEVRADGPQTSHEHEVIVRVEHCPTCGADLLTGSRFCGQCGRALAATLAPVPGDLVTIVFMDLEGFTTFASRAEEEEVRELIRAFHPLVREQVGQHGGFEVKQMGDGFMLAFSSPARAVSQDAHSMGASIRLSAGLNSGDAIREGDDFFGHTVNVASRIADRAAGGQVLVSEATRVLAGHVDGVRFADAGRRRLRGLRRRHRLFEVVWWE
jgi:class 3 adenylate cyclase